MLAATCHCGAVRIEAERTPDALNECLCSICRRYGARWDYYAKAELWLPSMQATETYEWGRRTIAFHRCRTCGCVTHWTSNDPARDKIGVNARLFDPADLAGVPVHQSDGPP
jgi:hypothetical protein